MVFSTPSLAVTFTRGGTFFNGGGGEWTLTAEFLEDALEDWNVTVSEMSRWDIAVSGGDTANNPPATLDITDFVDNPLDSGLAFSGIPSAPTFLHFFSPTTSLLRWNNVPGIITFGGHIFSIEPGGVADIFTDAISFSSDTRNSGPEPFGPPVVHTPPPTPTGGAVPEPITAGLSALGLASLVMSLRRRRNA